MLIKPLRPVVLIFFILSLCGCKTDLYSGLSQKEGNEMLAILLASGIETNKEVDGDGLITLKVDESEVSRALMSLKSQGYPKEKFVTLDKVFPDEGLISSPVAEKARLMYVKSQEISSTLSQIDGVITARVHIVRPEEKSKSNRDKKEVKNNSSASVFIKHLPNIDIGSLVPQIKLLVNNSIENLDYERISVILVPAVEFSQLQDSHEIVSFLFIDIVENSKTNFILLIISFLIMLISSNIGIYLYFKK